MINKFRYKKPSAGAGEGANDKNGAGDKSDAVTKVNGDKDDGDYVFSAVLTDEQKRKLKELFSQLQFSTETALPPDALRRALAESFFDQQRFQLGFMDDAAECFENMLLRIHTHIAYGEAEDMCSARHCIPHQKFAMTLVEQSVCGQCGASSEPLSYTQMVHYVSTSTLVYQVRANNNRTMSESFGQLLRKADSMGDVRTCPSACGAVIQIGRSLMNRPEIVSVGLVWNSERPTLEHIMEVFSTIGTTLRMGEVFNSVIDTRWADTSVHQLVGVVTYYGKHYSTFFFHTKLRVWIYFDDATVREVGPRWEQVVEKCRKGRYQPLLLLYALPDGTPVNTDNAPKQITAFYNDKLKKTPSQSVLRRSITPSPEKPIIGNTRRAITPNPDGTLNQKPPLPRPCNEYQNLSIIQKNIYGNQPADCDVVDGCISRKEPEYVTRKSLDYNYPKPQVNIHRTLSNSSSSGVEGMSIPDHMNIPRRRDSGNWSGDRNSASSASSTTMENPYLYLVGKVPNSGGSIPGSPTRSKSDSSGDAGYDSYSLSSNDSSTMTTLQHLMKMGHLAKIPEDYNNVSTQVSLNCDALCNEADDLLVKSRQLEDEHDLVLALALCNAAATKARAAMNAPYNNPQTLTLARMKHNTCIMRARSLHRRMTQTQNPNKENPPEIRHTREGSSGSGRHSRQNSRDKGLHSRQNSRELLVVEKEKAPHSTKNIEIYATLPKKKDVLKSKLDEINIGENAEYMLYDKPPNRESRSIFSRSKNKESQKVREKRSRSEDRNKLSRDFSIAPEIITGKDTLKKAKEEKEDKKDKDGKTKKQHKIRRKLLMGGLIKRKNRSMPDLTDTAADEPAPPTTTVDDSSVGLKGSETPNGMCGYLSEGHLEFTGNNANPNLERSKLMRKSFHGSAGKILTAAKVPPPPPLRTTSTLSKAKSNGGEVCNESERKYSTPNDISYYQNQQQFMNSSPVYNQSLPYISNYQNAYDSHTYYGNNTVITKADVHHEHTPPKNNYNSSHIDSGVDEVDCLPSPAEHQLELPPYPSPMGSAIHSRQASEEFPPPPPPLDLSALDEYLQKPTPPEEPSPNSLLAQLQNKRREILTNEGGEVKTPTTEVKSSGHTWLKELQAKQAALRMKKSQDLKENADSDSIKTVPYEKHHSVKSVKDLASKFEITDNGSFNLNKAPTNNNNNSHNVETTVVKDEPIPQRQIDEEILEVEMLSAAVKKTLNMSHEDDGRRPRQKKKSVSFCDQVILVATAEDQEDDSYIPNPILERVLRTAMNKPESAAIRQEIIALRENEMKKNESQTENIQVCNEEVFNQQPLYVRRNSVDNLLNQVACEDSPKNYGQPVIVQRRISDGGQYQPHNGYNNAPEQHVVMPQQVPPNGYCNGQVNSYHQVPPQYVEYGQYSSPSQPQYKEQEHCNPQYSPAYGNQPHYGNTSQLQNSPQTPSPMLMQSRQMQPSPNTPQNNQYNGHTPFRQSPYQPIPQNSPAYAYYNQNRPQNGYRQSPADFTQTGQYSPVNRPYVQQHRQTPVNQQNIYANHHSPSPAPSNASYNYHPAMYKGPNNNYDNQRTPEANPNPNYRMEYDNQSPTYQRLPQYYPERSDVYQRVPMPHPEQMYQPKALLKKTVSFEPGTKGGDSPTPKAMVTPIVVNNANNSVPTDKTKCNLCRKKNVVALNLYCTDCEFYMSRFKPKS